MSDESTGLASRQSPRKRAEDVRVGDFTMMVRVPHKPAAVKVYFDAEQVEAAQYAAETGGEVVALGRGCRAATVAARWLHHRSSWVPGPECVAQSRIGSRTRRVVHNSERHGVTVQEVAAALPDIATLQKRCLAVAMLDAILAPEWEDRRYLYTADWGDGAAATEIRDGSGNDCFIVYTPDGAFIKGLDHESPMAPGRSQPAQLWPGLVDDVPDVFADLVTVPAFAGLDGTLNATFCIWRQHHDTHWQTGAIHYIGLDGREDPDGAWGMLGVLTDPTPRSYRTFAASYFGVDPDLDAVGHVFDLRPLTHDVVHRINPHATLDDLGPDITSAGYPTGV